jgi:hypothetical protein
MMSLLRSQLGCIFKEEARGDWRSSGMLATPSTKKSPERPLGVLRVYGMQMTPFPTTIPERKGWRCLTPMDWAMICDSILLVSVAGPCMRHFAAETMYLSQLRHEIYGMITSVAFAIPEKCDGCGVPLNGYKVCGSCRLAYHMIGELPACSSARHGALSRAGYCGHCGVTYMLCPVVDRRAATRQSYDEEGVLRPVDESAIKMFQSLEHPNSVDAPEHFGHLMYTFCAFMDTMWL